MGAKLCKGDPLIQGQKLINQVLDVIACDGNDDENEYDEVKLDRVTQGYPPSTREYFPPNSGKMSARGSARPAPAPAPVPGESTIVTYDVGQPGQSMVVTGPPYAPQRIGSIPKQPGESMVVTGPPYSAGSIPKLVESEPAVTAATLEPTKSFDMAAPYKVGHQVEIWSASSQAWCVGKVEKENGEHIHVNYASPTGQPINKVMPNGHEHLRFPHHGNDNKAPAGAAGGSHSSAPGAPPSAPAPQDLKQSPMATGAYKVGDGIELFSASQNAWCRGEVMKADGEWVTVAYKGSSGTPMTKIMPNGHEQLRRPEVPLQNAQRSLSKGALSPTATVPLATADGPPPPPQRPYAKGDDVEIWSTSQNTWCKGKISKVEGNNVTVAYRGPGGQAVNKIMPNGHAQLRMLRP